MKSLTANVLLAGTLALFAAATSVAEDYTPEPKYVALCMRPDMDPISLANATAMDFYNTHMPYVQVKLDDRELIHNMSKGELCGLLPQE
jgi:hypothetical protein